MKRTRVERGIYRQQNGTYGVYLLVDSKPRYKTVGTKLAEARRQRDHLSAKAQRGELPTPTRLTFAQLAETWTPTSKPSSPPASAPNAHSRTTATTSTNTSSPPSATNAYPTSAPTTSPP
jgi:hypothetical protein